MYAARSRMHQDGEDLDYTLFAGVARPRAAVLSLQLKFSRTNLASSSRPPPTPTPAKSKRSLATWLANQILEEDEDTSETETEEGSDSETLRGESNVTVSEAAPSKVQVTIIIVIYTLNSLDITCSIVEFVLSLHLTGAVFRGYWSREHYVEDLFQVFHVGQWIPAIHYHVCSVPGVSGKHWPVHCMYSSI